MRSWPPLYHPPSQPRRNLVTQVTGAAGAGALRLEDQLTEFVAWLLSRSDALARDLVAAYFTDDARALAELTKSWSLGVETQLRLPPIGPGDHLRPDLSITGVDRTFQLLIEVKAGAGFHEVQRHDGTMVDQVVAYEQAWDLLDREHEARVRRIGTLGTVVAPTAPPSPRRARDLTWGDLAEIIRRLNGRGQLNCEIAAVAVDLANAVDQLFGAVVAASPEFLHGAEQLVRQVATSVAQGLGGSCGSVVVRTEASYAGCYVTFDGVEKEQERVWVFCTPAGGWYAPPGHPTAVWLASTDEGWGPSTAAALRRAGFARTRDLKGYTADRIAFLVEDQSVIEADRRSASEAAAWARGLMTRALRS